MVTGQTPGRHCSKFPRASSENRARLPPTAGRGRGHRADIVGGEWSHSLTCVSRCGGSQWGNDGRTLTTSCHIAENELLANTELFTLNTLYSRQGMEFK